MTPQERIEAHIIGEMRDDLCWETDYSLRGKYPRIQYQGRSVSVHRLAWEIHNCQPVPPGLEILHSCEGYYYVKRLKKYQAQIRIKGKRVYLGLYSTPEEAREVYLKARTDYVNSLTPFIHDHPPTP